MSTATVDLGGEVVLIVNSSDSPAKKKELTSSRKSSVSGNSTRPPISRKLLRQATMKDMTNHNITKSEKNATAAITHTTSLILTHGQEYRFGDNIDCTRLFVEYEYRMIGGGGPKLWLSLYTFDDRGRIEQMIQSAELYEEEEMESVRLPDGSAALIGQVHAEKDQTKGISVHGVKINFAMVDPAVTAMLVCLNGGPRSFNHVNTATVRVASAPGDRGEGTFLAGSGSSVVFPLFSSSARTRKDCLDIAVLILFKDGWDEDGNAKWVAVPVFEPIFQTITRAKEAFCSQVVIGVVPCLEICRPLRGLCAALSSEALPKLKKKFIRGDSDSLNIKEFTEALFIQLHESHPKILEDMEACYSIAMIEEMFLQIDYNGDGGSSWNEFTTFLSITGLGGQARGQAGAKTNADDPGQNQHNNQLKEGEEEINESAVEYNEDPSRRDHFLSSSHDIWEMRHFPDTHRIAIIFKNWDRIMMVDEDFKLLTMIDGGKLCATELGIKVTTEIVTHNSVITPSAARSDTMQVVVYDIMYIPSKDLYAFSASDHSITIMKETHSHGAGRLNYSIYDRFLSQSMQGKLCWSEAGQVLCSVSSDGIVYGWELDGSSVPVFQVSRHSDLVTDFIAVDHMCMFVTCSMDRRIVMWSASNRRVKAVWAVHKRGVRCLSNFENILLSGSFDCDARTFDLATKEVLAIMHGHRHPIAAVKLMCDRAATEREHRALTVDEQGEFRLWNIYVRERASEALKVPVLQTFHMQNPEVPLCNFRWICMPENGQRCVAEYNDFFACSTKLMHFVPVKTQKAFSLPTAILFHQSSGFIVTAVGRTIMKYDISTGAFLGFSPDVSDADITAMCEDGLRGRRLLCGNEQGRYYLINFTDGSVIDELKVHTKGIINEMKAHTMEITSLVCRRDGDRTIIYSCSVDGSIALCEELAGRLSCRFLLDQCFGYRVGVQFCELASGVRAIVAASSKAYWGVWDDASLRKIIVVREKGVVNAVRTVCYSRDEEDLRDLKEELGSMSAIQRKIREKENMLTVAVATSHGVNVYTLDCYDVRGVHSFTLLFQRDLYVTNLVVLRLPMSEKRGSSVFSGCVNYAITQPVSPQNVGTQIFITTDDGSVMSWNANHLRKQCEKNYRMTFKNVARNVKAAKPNVSLADPKEQAHLAQAALMAKAIDLKNSLALNEAALMLVGRNNKYSKTPRGGTSFASFDGSSSPGTLSDAGSAFSDADESGSERGKRNSRDRPPKVISKAKQEALDGINNKLKYLATFEKKNDNAEGFDDPGSPESPSEFKPPSKVTPRDVRNSNFQLLPLPTQKSQQDVTSDERTPSNKVPPTKAPAHETKQQLDKRILLEERQRQKDELQKRKNPHNLPAKDLKELNAVNGKMAVDFFILPIDDDSASNTPKTTPRGGLRRNKGGDKGTRPRVVQQCIANRDWKAHSDGITNIVSLDEHGCLLTLSLDGYHRLWNIDKVCIGEMPLPNLLEDMRNEAFNFHEGKPMTGWKFVLQRIPVLERHKEMALRLTRIIRHEEGTHRRIQRILENDNKHTLRVPTTSNGIRSTPEVVSLPQMTPIHQLFPSRGTDDYGNDDDNSVSSSSSDASVSVGDGSSSLDIVNRSVSFGVSHERPSSAQLAGKGGADKHSHTTAYKGGYAAVSLITPMYPRDEQGVGGAKEDDEFPWTTTMIDQGATTTTTSHLDMPASGGGASGAGGDEDALNKQHQHHHHHHHLKNPPKSANPPVVHGYESEQDAFRTGLLVSLTKPRDEYEADVKPTKILTKKDMAGLLHRKADEWATEQAKMLSAKTGVRRSSVSLLSQGIAAITEANFNANKSAKTSSKFPHSNSDTSLSERENGLKLSPSPSTSFGLAHQLALGSSLDNDSQSVTTALTTSTANTSTPYKTTLTQTTIPYPTSSNPKNNKPFKIPVRINPPHSRASTASSRASTASGTTRPLTGSKWNSRESTAQNNRARARPPTASNAYPITNNSHMEGSTSQSVCSISTIGQGGVESVVDYSSVRTDGDDTQPFRFRRRAVDPIYPPGTAEKFGVQAIAKIHQHEEAFRISCVTGNLVSDSVWLAPEELGIANKGMDIKFKLTQPFTKLSLLSPNYVDPLDVESYHILSELTRKEPERLANFGNSEDYLLLRSPARSTCTAVPPLADVKPTDAIFGTQSPLYKNASRYTAEKNKLSNALVRHNVVMSRIDDNVRKVHTMLHSISKRNAAADLFGAEYDDEEEEAFEYDDREALEESDSLLQSLASKEGRVSSMNHADVLSTVASDAYLGDVAEGWDKESEFKTRVRLHKSATMVPPEAAMKVRSLNKHRLQQIVDKVSDVVREEENIMKTFEEGMHAVLKKEAKKALLTTSQDTLRNLETKLVARIRFVLSAYVLKRIEEIKKDDEALELSPHNPSNNRRAISPSMSTRPSFNGQVKKPTRPSGNSTPTTSAAIFGAGSQTITHSDQNPLTMPAGLASPNSRSRRPSPTSKHPLASTTTSPNTSTSNNNNHNNNTGLSSPEGKGGHTSHDRMPRLTLLASPTATAKSSTPGTPTRGGSSVNLNAMLPKLAPANTIRGMPIPTSPLLVKSRDSSSQGDKTGSEHSESARNSLNNSIRSDYQRSQKQGQWQHEKQPSITMKLSFPQLPSQPESRFSPIGGSNSNSMLFSENDIGRALALSDRTFGGLTTERLYTGQVLDHLEDDSDDDDDDDDDGDDGDNTPADLADRDDWLVGSGRVVDSSRSNSIGSNQFRRSRRNSMRSNTRKNSDGQYKAGTATDPPQYSLQLPHSSKSSAQHSTKDQTHPSISPYSTAQSEHPSPQVETYSDHSPHSHHRHHHESHQDHALASEDATNHPPSPQRSATTAEGKKGSDQRGSDSSRRVSKVPNSRRVSMSPSVNKQESRRSSSKQGSRRSTVATTEEDDNSNSSKKPKKAAKVSINVPVPTSKKGLLDQGVVYLDETDEKGNRKQRSLEEQGAEKLTNRKLQPHYKVDDVLLFCDIFASADEDFQGELDIDEWAHLFTKMDKSASVQQARLIFLKIDENNSGSLSIGELIPVVFNKANRAQIKLITNYASSLLVKNLQGEEPDFSSKDAEQLFDAYDEENVNFVTIGLIRERVRSHYHLIETIQYQFLFALEKIPDDEMFSRVEFYRFLKPYMYEQNAEKKP